MRAFGVLKPNPPQLLHSSPTRPRRGSHSTTLPHTTLSSGPRNSSPVRQSPLFDVYASAATPKRIVTAGLGGVFPPGLVLGYVQDLELDTNGLFKSGTVLLDPRLNELHEVAVLVSLNPEQP